MVHIWYLDLTYDIFYVCHQILERDEGELSL